MIENDRLPVLLLVLIPWFVEINSFETTNPGDKNFANSLAGNPAVKKILYDEAGLTQGINV